MPTGKTGVCTTHRDLGLQGTSAHPMGKFVGNPYLGIISGLPVILPELAAGAIVASYEPDLRDLYGD
jgi:hypothetical protein